MTQIFRPNGDVVPATVLRAGPCIVIQRKTAVKDGYEAAQICLVELPGRLLHLARGLWRSMAPVWMAQGGRRG